MAVYTSLDRAELNRVWQFYDQPPLSDAKGIAEGVSNTNYCLTLINAQKFILTLFETRTPEADLPYFITLMEHLSDRGFPNPRPLRMRDGEALFRVAARVGTVVSFLPGASVTHPSPTQCLNFGKVLGCMHRLALDCPMRRANSMDAAAWADLLRRSRQDSAAWRQAVALADHLQMVWPIHLPQGAIHADPFPDNVFFEQDTVSGVIDYYFACYDLLAYDVALAINAWCIDPQGCLLKEHARALLAGYQTERVLESAERDAMPMLLQAAALRIFATRHYDWLNRPADALMTPKDPEDYARILAFHQSNPDCIDPCFG